MSERIYVQIPAYRDPELLPTLANLFETAAKPDRLRVAVAWQYGDDERHLEAEFVRFTQVELIKVPARYSSGCNWARSLLQQRWAGEAYTLLLDSHHRFVPAWDAALVGWHEELRSAGVAKPILTGYLPYYNPQNDPSGRMHGVLEMYEHERLEGLLFRLIGHPVADVERRAAPTPARFVSLHCLFADGRFNEEIHFDPEIYFFADEVAIALRAFTHGYDLFHPHRSVGWHLYDRSTRVAHWDDHAGWLQQQADSIARLRALYRGMVRGRHGIGTSRTIAAYEAHIGAPLVNPEGKPQPQTNGG